MSEKIAQFLKKASEAYYTGTPIIPDSVYDSLTTYYKLDSVVGHEVKPEVAEPHYRQMFSLNKHYDDSDQKNPLEGYKDISYSPKLDGAAISILYYKGNLVKVLTRGDGIVGRNITDKFLSTAIIPKTVPTGVEYLQIEGEIVAPSTTPNSRNYAAGALSLLDINEFKTRAITFFAYGIYPEVNSTYEEDMTYLSKIGFTTVKDNDIDKIYPTDGIVYRINKYTEAYKLGYTAHHPRFAYARKERQETVDTVILDVEWATGRTGVVVPVAILSPVQVGDKTVTKATLHNEDFIKTLDLCIGDTVAVRLAGMIIPEVVHKVEA